MEKTAARTFLWLAALICSSSISLAGTSHTETTTFCHSTNKVHGVCLSTHDDSGILEAPDTLAFKCELRRETSLVSKYEKFHSELGETGRFHVTLNWTLMANVEWCTFNKSKYTIGPIFSDTGDGQDCKTTLLDGGNR